MTRIFRALLLVIFAVILIVAGVVFWGSPARADKRGASISDIYSPSGLGITDIKLTCNSVSYEAVHPDGEHVLALILSSDPEPLASVSGLLGTPLYLSADVTPRTTITLAVLGQEDGDSLRTNLTVPDCRMRHSKHWWHWWRRRTRD